MASERRFLKYDYKERVSLGPFDLRSYSAQRTEYLLWLTQEHLPGSFFLQTFPIAGESTWGIAVSFSDAQTAMLFKLRFG